MKLTLGFSPCPNDTFIFDALVNGRIDTRGLEFDVLLDDVEALNARALEGRLDVTKLSYHAYGRVTPGYVLLNSGSALGKGCGPLLIARKPLDEPAVNRARVAVPGELTTAGFLFRLAYPQAGKPVVTRFDRIEQGVLDGEYDAGVIIHENRFTYAAKGLVEVADLGRFWEDTTGYPIPLGGIAARRSLPDRILTELDGLVRQSLEYARAHPSASDGYVRCHAQEMDPEVMRQHIDLYVNDYSLDLGTAGRAAVEFMLGKALELGMAGPLTRPLILPRRD